jgi:peptidoglycan hydrolase-like protein with peptidoglycan-binding domain
MKIENRKSAFDDAGEEILTIPREVFDLDEPDIPVSQTAEPDVLLTDPISDDEDARKVATLTRVAVLATAAQEIGYDTKSGAKYWEGVGKASWTGAPWCAAFVQWCLKVNGSWYPAPLPYYVPSFVSQAKSRGEWVRSGTPGDFVCFDWGGDGVADHVGILERNTVFGIQTIEGNTSSGNAGSQNNGGGVWRRIRTSGVMGYVHFSGYGKETNIDPDQFPLPKGHWYGPDDGTAYSHSGVRGYPDIGNIETIQKFVGTDVDGSYGPKTKAAVLDWEKANNDTLRDGLVAVDTWDNMVDAGLNEKPEEPTWCGRKNPPLEVDGMFGRRTTYYFQKWLGTYRDRVISGQPSYVKEVNTGLRNMDNWKVGDGGSNAIRAHQRILKDEGLYNDKIDGIAGPNYWAGFAKYFDAVEKKKKSIRRVWNGDRAVKELQKFLNRKFWPGWPCD